MNSHERAEHGVNKVLQGFFVIFVIAIIAVFVVKILGHTDGTVVVVEEENPACWNSTKELLDNSGMKAVKCKN